MDYEIENENELNNDEEYNDNKDENTNEIYEILHQPSPHNIPNINNQKKVSNEIHQNQVEEAESFTLGNDNLSEIFQNTEEEGNQNNNTSEMYQEYFKKVPNKWKLN